MQKMWTLLKLIFCIDLNRLKKSGGLVRIHAKQLLYVFFLSCFSFQSNCNKAALAKAKRETKLESQPKVLRILSDRTQSHLLPIFERYKERTGIEIQSLFVEKGLLARLQTSPREADIVITKDADLMEIAKEKRLISSFRSDYIENIVPKEYRDSENFFFSDSYRGRVIFYSKDRVRASDLVSYKDLAHSKWKKKICIRSGYDDYNLNLFAQWLIIYGRKEGKELIQGLHDNLALNPSGNDRQQIRNILEKKCDLALANSYYMGIMLNTTDQRSWGLSSKVFFPDQKLSGTAILRSGLALTKNIENREASIKFLEYMVSPEVQKQTSELTFAYPVTNAVGLPKENVQLGEGQVEVKGGVFKINNIPLSEIVKLRQEVAQFLDQIQFDKAP
ncbi:MAG: extracellular solute-binding protein [Bdellovibrionales bacterium]|nr:extracellular solute-binding protein [Bdellovibrionales bacterium]